MMPPDNPPSLLPAEETSAGSWKWFATMTFRANLPMHRAHIAWERLRVWLSTPAWRNQGGRAPFTRLLWCVEPHETGYAHIHALLASTQTVYSRHCRRCGIKDQRSFKQFNESWFYHHGIARFRPYDPSLRFGALRYIVKYVLDERRGDDVVWGIWDAGIDYGRKVQ